MYVLRLDVGGPVRHNIILAQSGNTRHLRSICHSLQFRQHIYQTGNVYLEKKDWNRVSPLGSGGYGSCFIVRDNDFQMPMALKEVCGGGGRDGESLCGGYIQREIWCVCACVCVCVCVCVRVCLCHPCGVFLIHHYRTTPTDSA